MPRKKPDEAIPEKIDKAPALVIPEEQPEIGAVAEDLTATPEIVAPVIEEAAEEAQPLSPEQDRAKMIYVTIAPYSSRYKQLAIEQHKNDPSLARGAVILGGKQFEPRKNYQVEETPEVKQLLKDGLIICMTGSFRFRVRDEPKAKVEGETA